MEGHLMATVTLTLRARVAWWTRPALAGAFLLSWIADRLIDWVIDRGIKFESP
jgi:hypothetical protein